MASPRRNSLSSRSRAARRNRAGKVAPPAPVTEHRRLRTTLLNLAIPLAIFLFSFALYALACDSFTRATGRAAAGSWDETWYRYIEKAGYVYNGNIYEQQNIAFFPLYPLLGALLMKLAHLSADGALLGVSRLSTLAAFVVLYFVLRRRYSLPVTAATLLLLGVGPFSEFLFNGYSEPVFLLGIALTFWFAVRSKWLASVLTIGVTSAGRPYGCLLAIVPLCACIEKARKEHGWRHLFDSTELQKLLLVLPLSFAGIALHTLYLGWRFRDPLAFAHVGRAWTSASTTSTVWNLVTWRYLHALRQFSFHGILSHPQLLGQLIFLLAPITLLLSFRKLAPAETFLFLIMIGLLHLLCSSNPIEITNLGRHLLVIYPYPLALALWIEPREWPLPRRLHRRIAAGIWALFVVALIVAGAVASFHYTEIFYAGTGQVS